MTEFAFALPILLGLSLYGFETANLAMAHLRVSNIASLTADNTARVRDIIDEAQIIQLLEGSKMTGASLRFAQNGRIILSSFERRADGRQWIRWQRCDGVLNVSSNYGRPRRRNGNNINNATEYLQTNFTTLSNNDQRSRPDHATLTGIGPAGSQVAAPDELTAVIVAEVVYNYQPIVSQNLFGPIQIRYEAAFNVRQRTDHNPRNPGGVTPRRCNTFAA